MHVIDYLKVNSLEKLKDEFGIKVREYNNGLVVLNYDQINSPKYHPIIKECRGLIIDIITLKPVSRTFNRFFNLNENERDNFNSFRLERVEEKADGSLISVYWYDDKWNIATRGTAYAEGETNTGITYHQLFLNIIGVPLDEFMKDQFRNESYTFELCSVYNKVVKLYTEPTIYLLNAVEVITGIERNKDSLDCIADTLNVKRPNIYNIDFASIISSFEQFPATEEGYVLIDMEGNRVKVKNPAYVNLHHLKGNGPLSPKRITNVVFSGETDEVLEYFPEYTEIFDPYEKSYNHLIKEIKYVFSELTRMALNQKDYAERAVKFNYSGILFSLRKGLTLKESIGKIGIESKVVLLEQFLKIYNGDL